MKTVLLTGASTGLGLAIARLLLSRSEYRLVLTAREQSLLRFAQAGIEQNDRVWIRALDVTDSEQRRTIVEEIDEKLGGVDVLINNAGISFRSVIEHVSEAERLEQMQVNFQAPIGLIRLVLPKMREKRAGQIINISSVGGMMAMPTMAIYSASKFALEGATEALSYEVKPWNIKVSLLQPGFINSSSFQKVHYTDQSGKSEITPSDPYYEHYHQMTPFIAKLMRSSTSTPEKVAQKVLEVMQQRNPRLRVPATLDAYFFYLLRRLLPRRIYHWILYRSLPNIQKWGKTSVGH